jgi:regulator of protease activity HflC (stomatin/prohibitin superfamily)
MGDVVNLRTARKRVKRRQAEQEAQANRLAHGQPKAERALSEAHSDKARRDLDQHRIETGD